MKKPVTVNERFLVGLDQPQADDVPAMARQGIRSVINLRASGEKGTTMEPEEEGREVRAAGMSYVHIPVASDNMTTKDVDRFRYEASALPGPVFVHCATGKRSGAFTMMDDGMNRGLSGDGVLDEATQMGFECDVPGMRDLVRGYVDENG